jgi:anti-sigma regulatory factor (Ser/Thr protein kinase)
MPTSSEADGQRGSWSSLPPPLAQHWRWRREFPGHQRELSEVRRWLRSLLPECPARDDVIGVASELASNAIQHTASGRGGWFAVELTWPGPAVRVAVADGGAPDGPRTIDDPDSEHGRGLLVVTGLSARTGVCGDSRGRLVWADVPWADAGAPVPGAGRDPYESVIGDGEASLAGRFAGVPAWFGRSTLQWWALARGGLVSAPSAQELARILGRLARNPPTGPAAGRAVGSDPGAARAWGQRLGLQSSAANYTRSGTVAGSRVNVRKDVVLTWVKPMAAHRARRRAAAAARIA